MSDINYKYFNPNPDAKINKKTGLPRRWSKGDCVVRAFCGATGKTWSVVFAELCAIAAKEFDMPNSHKVIDIYASENGFVKLSLPEYLTVNKFTEIKKGTYVLNIRGHVACVKDGQILDTWNCGRYKVKTYYWKRPLLITSHE